MADPLKPVLRGENVPLTVFVDRVPQRHADICKKLSVEEDSVDHADQYNGRARVVRDKQVDGYSAEIDLDIYDSTLLDALLAVQAKRDANQPIPEITVLFTLNNRDGAVQAYYLTKCVSKYKLEVGGRTESVGQTLSIKAEDLKKSL